jgi:predicted nucleotidyltransferase
MDTSGMHPGNTSMKEMSALGQDLAIFCKVERILLLILFGSRVRSSADPSRDIDLAVQLKRGCEPSKLDLLYELGTLFQSGRIDLVLLTPMTQPLLRYEIYFKGRVLYEETEGLFEQGKLMAWKLYLDTAPLRKREIEYLKEFPRRMKHVT